MLGIIASEFPGFYVNVVYANDFAEKLIVELEPMDEEALELLFEIAEEMVNNPKCITTKLDPGIDDLITLARQVLS